MDDTHLAVKAEYHRRIMQVTGERRMIMGSRMFDACREMSLASLPEDLSDTEIRMRLFLRFYGNEFDEETREEIVEYLGELG